ncbi:MAG: BrnT family toxin [Candidatus Methylumidiphilus sp.]
MRFEWDEAKNQANIRKHGVDFRDAAYVFSDPFALNIPDDEHSTDEERWVLLGRNRHAKILLVVHTFRQGDSIRLISARKATPTEQATYLKRAKK